MRVDTLSQLADANTKALPRPQFEELRKQINGWVSLLTYNKRHSLNDKELNKNNNIMCNLALWEMPQNKQ